MVRYEADGVRLGVDLDQAATTLADQLAADGLPGQPPSGIPLRWWDHLLTTAVSHELGAAPASLAPSAWTQRPTSGRDSLAPDGVGTIISGLARDLRMELDAPVTRLRHNGSEVIADVRTGSRTAQWAVVTVPLGVLKAGSIEFDPPLPAAKLAAHGRLGVGLVDKVVLRFPATFWDPGAQFIGRVAPTGEPQRWASWLNLGAFVGEPILVGFNAGSVAADLAGLDDDAIVTSALDALAGIYSS